jgi:GAF domain-containing protein
VTKLPGVRRVPLGAELVLALAAGAASFALVATTLAVADSVLGAVILGAVLIPAVVATARFAGVAYAVPIAIAALVAYDWFQLPPTHAEELPDAQDLLSLLTYLAVGTFVGELTAYEARRAETSEAARGALVDEQAALRRVATLVAREASQAEVFTAISEEFERLLAAEEVRMLRFEDDGRFIAVVAGSGRAEEIFPVASRHPLGGENAATRVFRTGRPARIDDYGRASGAIAETVRRSPLGSVVATPIVVDGRLWGAMAAGTTQDDPMPPQTEARMAQFTELMATTIANAESHLTAQRLTDEQAALRRVATLVAEGASPSVVLDAVSAEMESLLNADQVALNRFEPSDEIVVLAHRGLDVTRTPVGSRVSTGGESVTAAVRRTGRPARMETYDDAQGPLAELARATGLRSSVSAPIVVEGRLWGLITASWKSEGSPPPDTEERMVKFTELVATAIANAESREALRRLADEQAALRRVATLVAEGVQQAELFSAVTQEVKRLFADVEPSLVPSIIRFDPGPEFVLVGAAKPMNRLPVGSRWGLKDLYVSTRVLRSGRSARVEAADLDSLGGADAELLRLQGFLYQVGSPIVVEGRPWGALTMNSARALPPDTGERLENFTELVATAIANTESREALRQLADEQAALHRVAELVARETSQAEIFNAIAAEILRLLGTDELRMLRYEGDRHAVVVAGSGSRGSAVIGRRFALEGHNATSLVFLTGRPARVDDIREARGPTAEAASSIGLRGVVAAPIVVDGRLWGALVTATARDEPLPPETEARLAQFTDLIATAIANTASRAELEQLAEEQAALRRLATLVAEGAAPEAVFDSVTAAMKRVLQADHAVLSRLEAGAEAAVVAHTGAAADHVPPGTRLSLDTDSVMSRVRRTARPARLDSSQPTEGTVATLAPADGIRSVVGAPVFVEGRVWGVISASWDCIELAPPDPEERVAKFAALLGIAIANADHRDQLTASRARLLTAADEARRRVVRDLHDGAQQRQVHTIVTLKLAQQALEENDGTAASLVGEALDQAQQTHAELRELAHGILPTVLTRGGLRDAVDSVVSRLDLRIDLDIPGERFPAEIEASAYFIIAEALTNVVKHAHAEHAEVRVFVQDRALHVEVRDDGVGGAKADGHGLVGMNDRVTALGGRLQIHSPHGDGTLLSATLSLSPVSVR